MKIITHFNAVTMIQAPWDEVRPVTGGAFGATTQLIKERYQFQLTGQSTVSQQIGLMTPAFQAGQFKVGDKIIPVNQLEFQPSSVVISCATTEQTNKFADDVFAFLHDALEYKIPPKERKRHHTTVIIVDFGPSFISLFGKFNEVARALNTKIKDGQALTPFGVRFNAINSENQMIPDRQYLLERRALTPPGEHWIYSQAPLDTDTHLEFLSAIDSLVND
jgi:hypothetical protein